MVLRPPAYFQKKVVSLRAEMEYPGTSIADLNGRSRLSQKVAMRRWELSISRALGATADANTLQPLQFYLQIKTQEISAPANQSSYF